MLKTDSFEYRLIVAYLAANGRITVCPPHRAHHALRAQGLVRHWRA